MKQLIYSIAVSLFTLYLICAFISLTPNVADWDMGGRAAYLLFSIIFGVVGYLIHFEANNTNKK